MAQHIVRHVPRPDLILCSTAARARQTLAGLAPKLAPPAPPILLETGLYLASEETLLARLQGIDDTLQTVLLIGHNDGLWRLAVLLAGHGRPALNKALQEKLPTGALATLRARVNHWHAVKAGSATLAAFVRPRELIAD